jgi:hypothetical protein
MDETNVRKSAVVKPSGEGGGFFEQPNDRDLTDRDLTDRARCSGTRPSWSGPVDGIEAKTKGALGGRRIKTGRAAPPNHGNQVVKTAWEGNKERPE